MQNKEIAKQVSDGIKKIRDLYGGLDKFITTEDECLLRQATSLLNDVVYEQKKTIYQIDKLITELFNGNNHKLVVLVDFLKDLDQLKILEKVNFLEDMPEKNQENCLLCFLNCIENVLEIVLSEEEINNQGSISFVEFWERFQNNLLWTKVLELSVLLELLSNLNVKIEKILNQYSCQLLEPNPYYSFHCIGYLIKKYPDLKYISFAHELFKPKMIEFVNKIITKP